MPICEKCGEEKNPRGFKKHVDNCKGKQGEPKEEKQEIEPKQEELLKEEKQEIEEKPKLKKEENPQEARETDNKNYSGILITIIALIIGFIAFIVFFTLPGDDTDAR